MPDKQDQLGVDSPSDGVDVAIGNEEGSENEEKSYVPYGATSFDEVEATEKAMELAEKTFELARNYSQLVFNIIDSPEIPNERVPDSIRALSEQFIIRFEALSATSGDMDSKESEGKPDGLLKKFVHAVSKALGVAESKNEDFVDLAKKSLATRNGGIIIEKDDGGKYRWVACYSNKFRDDDNPAEIISSESHRKFAELVKSKVAPLPELWLWHVPEWRFGQSEWVSYDESGFAMAGGHIYDDPASIAIAKSISEMDDVRVSHGMPRWSIQRDDGDPTIITEHITQEISPLPGWAAANRLTGFGVVLGARENKDMAFTKEEKQRLIEAHGVTPGLIEALEAMNATNAKAAEELGIESKEAESEEDVEKEVDTTTEDQEKPEDDGDIEAKSQADTVENEDIIAALKQTMEVVAALGAQVKELTGVVGELKQADEERVAKQARVTPFASQLAMMQKSVIGNDAARVDGRTTLGKSAPEEAEETPIRSITGIPLVDQWVS